MARCFPYPPPGHTLGRHSQAAMIQSTKLQQEGVNDQGRDSKTEKSGKRKGKKDKATEGQINGKQWLDTKGKTLDHKFTADTESLERSGVTVELKQPVRLHVPTSSSESTENSSNRRRPLSPIPCERRSSDKKIVRIRLTKKRSLSDSLATEEHPCSTSGKEEDPLPRHNIKNNDFVFREDASRATTISQRLHFKTQGDRRLPIDHQIETANAVNTGGGATTISRNLHSKVQGDHRPLILHQIDAPDAVKSASGPSSLDSATRKKQKAYLKYANLIDNWVSLPLDAPPPSDGEDWLFKTKSEKCHHPPQARQTPCLPSACCSSASWPRAQYLPEMDMYALPYAIPF